MKYDAVDAALGARRDHLDHEMSSSRFRWLLAHERHRQIEGWLLGPPTAADERDRAQRIEELLAA